MSLQNANRAAMRGITTAVFRATAARRAYQPTAPPRLSSTEVPCGGRRQECRGQDHLPHSRRAQFRDHARDGHAAERVSADHHLAQSRALDIGDHRIDTVSNAHRGQIAGFAPSTGKVDGQHGQLWCQPADFADREVPAVAGVSPAVDEDQRRQCHGDPFDAVTVVGRY